MFRKRVAPTEAIAHRDPDPDPDPDASAGTGTGTGTGRGSDRGRSRGSDPGPDADMKVAHPTTSVNTLVIAALIVLGVVGLVWILGRILDTVVVLLIAVVFAEGIRPMVTRLRHRIRMPQGVAILIVYSFLVAILGVLVALLVQPIINQAQLLAANFDAYQRATVHAVGDLEARFHVTGNLSGTVAGALSTAKDVLLTIGEYIIGLIVDLVIVLLLAFMWLASSDRLKHFVVDLFPLEDQPLASDIIREIGFRMGGYLRAVAINMAVIGVLVGLASAFLLHLPSPLLLGIFAGLTEAIPIAGPFIGAAPAVLLGFTVSPLYPIIVALVFLVIQQIESNTLVPVVMNRVVALPPLAVVLALLIGGTLRGIAGTLLAVPVAAAIQVLILRWAVPSIHRAQDRQVESPAVQR